MTPTTIGIVIVVLGVALLGVWLLRRSAVQQLQPPAVAVGREAGPAIDAELAQLMAQGQKLEAIRRLRAATGLGLAEAKAYVERLGAGSVLATTGAAEHGLEPDDSELWELVRRGQKIEAIRRVRARTGLGLKEAKDYVDRLGG